MKYIYTVIFTSFLLLSSCGQGYDFNLEIPKKIALNDTITVTLTEKNNQEITKLQFFVNGKEITSNGNAVSINTADFGIGKHAISVLAFFDETSKKINNSFEVLAEKKPELYNYKIINSYPHDTKAFTQGLAYYKGFLYETTGYRGQSTLRKVALKTGEVLQKIDLDSKYFGEGMTIVNDKILWLTWQGKKGFVYDLNTFKQEGEFDYNKSKEGWGLAHNTKELMKSDGSNQIWFLNLETQKEIRSIQVYTNKRSLKSLNELEWVNEKIYANYWQKPLIAIINPKNGAVEGIVNLTNLVKEMEKTQKLIDQQDVLNGIAYDAENDRLFVTGKNWGKLFEIELIKKQ
jgi:glutamine cyclotransferase